MKSRELSPDLHIFKILQIGDIHFPDKENTASPVDSKDAGFPASLTASIGTSPLQAIFRSISQCLEDIQPDLIAIMGDYTNRGDNVGLRDCLSYIRRLLLKPDDFEICQLLFGNHDVDRRLDPETDDRFDLINDMLAAEGFRKASVLQPDVRTVVGGKGAQLRVFGINSCRGCGQIRRLGPILEKRLGPEIAKILNEGGTEAQINELYESIDTPAIDDETIQVVRDSISALGESVLPVICAHHNLLPQTTPRIAPYAELLNAGSVRAALMKLDRPVLYLHGHLHDDPVEVIRTPSHPRGALVSVCAPLLRDGFNVLEVAFNDDDVPLGCQLVCFRRNGSHVDRSPPQTISIWTASEGLRMASEKGRELMKQLEPDRVTSRTDLLKRLSWDESDLDGALIELRWLGIVEIQNPERPSLHWRCMRVI